MCKETCGNNDLPADTRGQVLHNEPIFRAHWRRISTEKEKKVAMIRSLF